MKFFQGFFGLLAVAAGMIFAALNFVIHFFVNAAMLAVGIAILAIDLLALAIWVVNWKYYPE